MPETPAQREQRLERSRKGGKAAAEKKRQQREEGSQAPPSSVPPVVPAAGGSEASTIEFDPLKVLRYGLNAPHDAMAVLLSRDDMRLSKTEEAVATSTVMTSLELVGWTRFIIYLAPIAAVMVLLAIEGHRIKILREWWGEREAEREIQKAERQADTFTQQFEDEVQPAREARSRQRQDQGARGVEPDELTYLHEEAI